MTTTSYPQRNPFPHQGVLSIEGTAIGTEADSPAQQPTLLLDPIQQLRQKTRSYLDRYQPNVQGQGQMIVLCGDHGSGKTHTIRYVMGEVAGGAMRPGSDVAPPLQIYAKAEGPSFLMVYKQLTSQIPMPLLRELSLRFFGVLAGRQIGRDRDSPEAGRHAAEELRREPRKIFELFSEYRVEEGAVQELQIKEVERVAGGIDDFKRAFSYLLTDDLCTQAYNWLTGQPVGADYLRKLGISGEIASDEVAKWGLQLLATIFNRAGHPLIICIDQYEKLVLDQQGMLISQSAGLLHSLVEVIPRENGMLVIAGNPEAWAALARDLKQRFAFNVIELSVLKPAEAETLIFIYLHPTDYTPGQTLTVTPADSDLFPFTAEAIRRIISFSGGNPRRLLQTCSAAFDEAFPEHREIDEALVKETVRRSSQIYFDSGTVKAEIRRLLNEKGLSFREEFPVQDRTVDFGVVDAQQTPRLLIKLRKAMFYDSEAREALAELNLVERIQQEGWPATSAFVVLGYVSPEVTATVRQFAPEYVVYHPETFRQQFDPILTRTQEAITTANASQEAAASTPPGQTNIAVKVDPIPSAELETIKAELQKLQATRSAEAQSVQEQLNLLLQSQATEKLAERRQAGRLAWVEERRKIEQQIQETREKRRQVEFEEIERLRASAVSNRQRKHMLRAAILFIPALIGFLLAFSALAKVAMDSHGNFESLGLFIAKGGGLWPLSVLFAIIYVLPLLLRAFNTTGTAMERELWAPIGSLKDLELVARRYASDLNLRFSPAARMRRAYRRFFPLIDLVPYAGTPYHLEELLHHPNPHFRYVGALSAAQNHDLKSELHSERSSFVRRAIAKIMARDSGLIKEGADRQWLGGLAESVPETAYLVEAISRSDASSLRQPWLPSALYTLTFIAEGGTEHIFQGVLRSHKKGSAVISDLARAYEVGLDRYAPSSLTEITDFHLREVIKELSPFDEGGLGMFDELQSIRLIDQLYLFFRQLQFCIERDLISQPAPPNSPGALSASAQS